MRIHAGRLVAGLDANTYALTLRQAQQVHHHLKAGRDYALGQWAVGVLEVVNAADIDAHFEAIGLESGDGGEVVIGRGEEDRVAGTAVSDNDAFGRQCGRSNHRGVPIRTATGTAGVHESSCADKCVGVPC